MSNQALFQPLTFREAVMADPEIRKGRLLTVKEMSVRFRRSESTIWRWIHKGFIPKGIRVTTRTTLWPEKLVDKFISELLEHSNDEDVKDGGQNGR